MDNHKITLTCFTDGLFIKAVCIALLLFFCGTGTVQSQSITTGLHVNGNVMNDGDGKKVILRGPELVIRWGTYSGITAAGVDVPWEGGTNNNVGSATIREMAKTKCNALRIYGGIGSGLDALLNTAIVEQKMFVGVGRVDWANAQMKATLDKYGKYVFLHPRGEFTHRDAALWRTEALTVVKYIRGLGYTQPIEIGTTGYGQTWSTIQTYGKEVADSDPLKNTLFLLQLYSELASDITGTMDKVAAFSSPVDVDACMFNEGITNKYGNNISTYKTVWDESFKRNFGGFYWDWWGDGNGNSMTSSGTFASLNALGKYIADESPAALKNTVKTAFLLNAPNGPTAVYPGRGSQPAAGRASDPTIALNSHAGKLSITVAGETKDASFSLFDMRGKVVFEKLSALGGREFSFDSKLRKGTYFLKIETRGHAVTKQVVIVN